MDFAAELILTAAHILSVLWPATLLVLAALFAPRLGSRASNAGWRLLRRISSSKVGFVTAPSLSAFCLAAAVSLFIWLPIPRGHDEFSYLLAADTLLEGRLSNPPHRFWPHFETFHVLQQPRYASKYPLAQGIFLALGQILGHPIVGMWLATALAISALAWMLGGWMPPRWALLVALLAILHPAVFGWSQGYWPGAVAFLGGTLLLGALPRMVKKPRAADGWLAAGGAALLLHTRPYEGAVLVVLTIAGSVLLVLRSPRPLWPIYARHFAVPVVVALGLATGAMVIYNERVTGRALISPYLVYEEQYSIAPPFVFQQLRPSPHYRHERIRQFHLFWRDLHLANRRHSAHFILDKMLTMRDVAFRIWTPPAPPEHTRSAVLFMKRHFSYVLIAPLVALPWALRRRVTALALVILLLFVLIALVPVSWTQPHYLAPALGLGFVLFVQSLRVLRTWRWRGRESGRFLVRVLIAVWLLSFPVSVIHKTRTHPTIWKPAEQRAGIVEFLSRGPDRHLVIVRYSWPSVAHFDWVYNRADIDASRVVWARAISPAADAELIRYFHGRRVWILEADANPPRLTEVFEPSRSRSNGIIL